MTAKHSQYWRLLSVGRFQMSERFQAEWKSAKQQEINRLASEHCSPNTSKKSKSCATTLVHHGDWARSVRRMSEAELAFHGFFLGTLEKHHGHF